MRGACYYLLNGMIAAKNDIQLLSSVVSFLIEKKYQFFNIFFNKRKVNGIEYKHDMFQTDSEGEGYKPHPNYKDGEFHYSQMDWRNDSIHSRQTE